MITNLFQQLERDEGKRLSRYLDSKGIPTIGIGHNLQASPCFEDGSIIPDVITDEQCSQLFDIDKARATKNLLHYLPWVVDLDEVRQGVLLNMSFNMGMANKWPNPSHGLMTFVNTLAFIRAGNYKQADLEMAKSNWARETGDRATRLRKQLVTGIWQ